MSDGGCGAAEHGLLVSHIIEGNNLSSLVVIFFGRGVGGSRNVKQTTNHLITTKNQPRYDKILIQLQNYLEPAMMSAMSLLPPQNTP